MKQTNKRGTNGYKIKHRYHFFSSVWFIAFVVAVAVPFVQPKIVSPCPESGCGVEIIYVKDAPSIQTVRERVILAAIRAWGTNNAESMERLVFKESGFNYLAINPASGSCGLFQFYPCKKMKCELVDVDCQIAAGVKYIQGRYGNANAALQFHLTHGYY